MSVIEFVGIPCSGKTRFYQKLKKLLKNKFNIFNYSDLFYIFSKEIINLSLFEKISLRAGYRIYKNRFNSKKTKNMNFTKKSLSLYSYLKSIIKNLINKKIELVKNKLINSLSQKEKKIFIILNESIQNSPLNNKQKIILKSRMMEELIGLHIYKKKNLKNCIILNDEGLFQRILSRVGKFEKKDIKKIFTNIDLFKEYFLNGAILFTKSSFNKIKLRSKKRKEGFKFNNFSDNEIKIWINVFNKFYKNYKKNKIFIIKDKNLIQTSNKIIKIQ